MAETLVRGELLRDIPVQTAGGQQARLSDFRGRRNIVLFFPGDVSRAPSVISEVASHPDLGYEEAVVLIASDAEARALYSAPKSALFIADRYGEIFFSVRHPDPLPDASEVLKWLEFINHQCPE